MKKLLTLILLLASIVIYGQPNKINLIPQPAEIQQSAGVFRLSGSSGIVYTSSEAKSIADMLAQKLNMATGFSLKAKQGTSGPVLFSLNKTADPKTGDEGYSLTVTPKNVTIAANKPAGLFYGMQTFLQLLPPEIESRKTARADWTIPAVKITDYPRFAWRGLMLDVSRNFFTKEDVKKYLDQMARLNTTPFTGILPTTTAGG